jgi:hypothetical protein
MKLRIEVMYDATSRARCFPDSPLCLVTSVIRAGDSTNLHISEMCATLLQNWLRITFLLSRNAEITLRDSRLTLMFFYC